MLALITERLQNQRLDDTHNQRSANIQLITAQGINFTGTKPSESPDQNRKAWSLCHEGKKRCVNRHKSGGDGKGPTRHHSGGESKALSGGLCFHRRPLLTCGVCSSQNATPPKKKHCRSLSIPADSVSAQVPWQPKGSCLWKPIAVCPMTLHPKQHKNKPYSPSLNRDVRGSRAASSLGCVGLRDMPGYHTPCDFNTPPESPVPRPASASSGFCDGSFSPIGAPWLELSPSRGSHRSDSFKHRSLSMEDRISTTPSVSVATSPSPSSPCGHRIPRCRSQPCVLHDRKCGLKRRRDQDRPTLNFRKMAETAYPSEHLNHLTPPMTRFTDYKSVGSTFRPPRFRDELHSATSLVPIASSPLDTEIPMMGAEFPKASPIKEVGCLSRPALSEDSGCSEVDETEEAPEGCPCFEDGEDGYHQATELFPIADLDVEEIESH